MNTRRIIAAVSALALATGLTVATTAAASAPSAASPTAAETDEALFTQRAGGYAGSWRISGDVLEESFTLEGADVSTGTSPLHHDVASDAVLSFGYVAGYAGEYAQLSGQAGSDVTAVRIISASGVTTQAQLADGVWGAVWLTGGADEYGPARIEVVTATGTTIVSTDDVDVIAAQQRADAQG